MDKYHLLSVQDMRNEGWCDGCEEDYVECFKQGKCKGSLQTNEEREILEELKEDLNDNKRRL